jgi:hypothetical protein
LPRGDGREGEYAHVDHDLVDARQIRRQNPPEERYAKERDTQSEAASKEYEREALHERPAHQGSPPSAECGPDGELTPTHRRPCENQVGDVDARQQRN